MLEQELHNASGVGLFSQRARDHGGFFLSDTWNLGEALRIFVDYIQGLGSELLNDASSRLLADSLYQATAQVSLKPLRGAWGSFGNAARGELTTELGMIVIYASNDEVGPDPGIETVSHDRYISCLIRDGQLDNGIAVIGVTEGNPLNYASNDAFVLFIGRGRIHYRRIVKKT